MSVGIRRHHPLSLPPLFLLPRLLLFPRKSCQPKVCFTINSASHISLFPFEYREISQSDFNIFFVSPEKRIEQLEEQLRRLKQQLNEQQEIQEAEEEDDDDDDDEFKG